MQSLKIFSLFGAVLLAVSCFGAVTDYKSAIAQGRAAMAAKDLTKAAQCFEEGLRFASAPEEKEKLFDELGNVYSKQQQFLKAYEKQLAAASVKGITGERQIQHLNQAGFQAIRAKRQDLAANVYALAVTVKNPGRAEMMQCEILEKLSKMMILQKKYSALEQIVATSISHMTDLDAKNAATVFLAEARIGTGHLDQAMKDVEVVLASVEIEPDTQLQLCRLKGRILGAKKHYADAAAFLKDKLAIPGVTNRELVFAIQSEYVMNLIQVQPQHGFAVAKEFASKMGSSHFRFKILLSAAQKAQLLKELSAAEDLLCEAAACQGLQPEQIRYLKLAYAGLADARGNHEKAIAYYLEIASLPKMQPNNIAKAYSDAARVAFYHARDVGQAKKLMDQARMVPGAKSGWASGLADSIDKTFAAKK